MAPVFSSTDSPACTARVSNFIQTTLPHLKPAREHKLARKLAIQDLDSVRQERIVDPILIEHDKDVVPGFQDPAASRLPAELPADSVDL